ncbi:hypothetical protein MPSEU_000370900 [Mayamaea pseudoterrestris]|nr:hypothetical protein MPSEU_000370900 [Mayamaea pseudoterrestris]
MAKKRKSDDLQGVEVIATDDAKDALRKDIKINYEKCTNLSELADGKERAAAKKALDREIKILTTALHDESEQSDILQLYTVCKDAEHYYFVTPFMPSGNLATFFRNTTTFSEKLARDITQGVAKGLQHLHDVCKFAHRDLRLETIYIILADATNVAEVKISGFGCANFVKTDNECQTLCGSPYFAAPEVLARCRAYDTKCDLWGLGGALYFMLSRRMPFGYRRFSAAEALRHAWICQDDVAFGTSTFSVVRHQETLMEMSLNKVVSIKDMEETIQCQLPRLRIEQGELRKMSCHEVYSFEEVLGMGSFGTVHKGIHRKTGVKYAIKEANTTVLKARSPYYLIALDYEIQMLRLLQNGLHIVRIFDVYEESDRTFIIMELMFCNLFERIAEAKRFTEREARRYCKGLIEGLHFMHCKFVAHRDVKGENVSLSK